jgi:hypothetical protein
MSPVRLVLWGGVALAVALTAGCFALARPQTALHSRSVGAGAAGALLGYVALLLLDAHSFQRPELVLFVFLLLPALLLLVDWDLWLVRADVAAVVAQIAAGCDGLFIQQVREPGGVRLAARGVESHIRLGTLGPRLTWMVLPRPRARGKVTLLVNWLANQYPGPFPRPRIRLQRGN